MKALYKSIVASGLLALSGIASAAVIQGNALQGVLNDITVGGDSSVNVHEDQVVNDGLWSLTGTGMGSATLVIELAGYAQINSFGVYDYSDPLNSVELFAGERSAGDKASLSIGENGEVTVVLINADGSFAGVNQGTFERDRFGYYLQSGSGETYYSENHLNASTGGEPVEGDDHMVAYQGKGDVVDLEGSEAGTWTDNEYILAWEDLPLDVSDRDYTDFVVMVESVEPVPEPAILAMFGLGLAAFGFASRKRK